MIAKLPFDPPPPPPPPIISNGIGQPEVTGILIIDKILTQKKDEVNINCYDALQISILGLVVLTLLRLPCLYLCTQVLVCLLCSGSPACTYVPRSWCAYFAQAPLLVPMYPGLGVLTLLRLPCLYLCTQVLVCLLCSGSPACTYVPRSWCAYFAQAPLLVPMYPGLGVLTLLRLPCLYLCTQVLVCLLCSGSPACTYVPRSWCAYFAQAPLLVPMYPGLGVLTLLRLPCLYLCTQVLVCLLCSGSPACTYVPRSWCAYFAQAPLLVPMYPGLGVLTLLRLPCLYLCTQVSYITFNTDLNLFCKKDC